MPGWQSSDLPLGGHECQTRIGMGLQPANSLAWHPQACTIIVEYCGAMSGGLRLELQLFLCVFPEDVLAPFQ